MAGTSLDAAIRLADWCPPTTEEAVHLFDLAAVFLKQLNELKVAEKLGVVWDVNRACPPC